MSFSINYITFTTAYPNYFNPPYDQLTITAQIEEILLLYPSIESCLPEEVRLMAVKYAIEMFNMLENQDSGFEVIESVKSRNDAIKYKVRGFSGDLSSNLWGNRLNKLFKTFGCFHYFGKGVPSGCSC